MNSVNKIVDKIESEMYDGLMKNLSFIPLLYWEMADFKMMNMIKNKSHDNHTF